MQGATKRAELQSVIRQIFSLFDSDADGRLSKDEYKEYIWATWNALGDEEEWEQVWVEDCQGAQCATETGITEQGFESLYLWHRSGPRAGVPTGKEAYQAAQDDVKKSQEWLGLPEAERQSHRDLTCLQYFEVCSNPEMRLYCSRCQWTAPSFSLTRMKGCRRCDYDLCEACLQSTA